MDSASNLLSQRRALVADLRSCGSDRLTRATIEAQIKMIDERLAEAVQWYRVTAYPVSLDVGHRVRWTSQAAGVAKTKEGIVERVVLPGERPDIKGAGMSRDHVSYVVRASGRLYWPRVSQMEVSP